MNRIPVLVAVGDFASGVTSWAFRLRDACAAHPKYRVVLLNCRKTGNKMGAFDADCFSLESARQYVQRQQSAILVPNFVFGLYALGAELARAGHDLRIIGFCRADSEEEYYAPLRFFEPAITQFAAVSPECVARLGERIPHRTGDIALMPTGVRVPPFARGYQTRPLRLIYAGRIVQIQKRVMDFVPLTQALLDRGVDFTLDIAGQGRDLPELQSAMAAVPHGGRVRFLGRVQPEAMDSVWANHEVFLQTSDFEGTSNSMLESMAQGLIPVLTRTESGVDGIVEEGRNGFLVDIGDMDAMASVVAQLATAAPETLQSMGRAAHEAASGYSIEQYVDRFTAMLDRAMAAPAPQWPADLPLKPPFGVLGITLEGEEPTEPGRVTALELLKNPEFKKWAGPDLPQDWTVQGGAVRRTETGEVELLPGEKNVALQQICALKNVPGDAWLEISAEVRAEGERPAGLNGYLKVHGQEKCWSANHSGNGEWQTLALRIPLDDKKAAKEVRFFLVLRTHAAGPAQVRLASLRLCAPAQGLPSLAPFYAAQVPPRAPDEKRLLILFPSPLRGGAEDYCVTMARGAIAAGWNVHAAFAPRQATASLIHDFTQAGAQYHPLDVVDVGPVASHAVPHKRVTRTYRLLRKVQPSAVLLELCGLQYGLGPMLACASHGIPTAVVFQMVREGVRVWPPQRILRALARGRNQHYVAVSDNNRELIAQAFKVPASQIELIPNGADPDRFACTQAERDAIRLRVRAELDLPPSATLIITVGRLAAQKGHDLLLPAVPHVVARFPNTRFIWAGDGPLENELIQQMTQYGVQHQVTLLGRRSDIRELLLASDVFAHPTRFEGQPFSVLEAMAARLPVVSTMASGITEVLEHGQTALLGRVEDIRDLRENLLYALGHPEEIRAMADRAWQRLQDFTEAEMIRRTLSLLEGSPG